MSDFVVKAKRPRYRQPSRNGMMVRMRSQDYMDLANVCTETNVRFCDLLHDAIRYAMDNLKVVYPNEKEGENEDDP